MFVGCWNDAVLCVDHAPFSGRTCRITACLRCAEEIATGTRKHWSTDTSFMGFWMSEVLPMLWAEIEYRAAWGGCSRLDVLREDDACL